MTRDEFYNMFSATDTDELGSEATDEDVTEYNNWLYENIDEEKIADITEDDYDALHAYSNELWEKYN